MKWIQAVEEPSTGKTKRFRIEKKAETGPGWNPDWGLPNGLRLGIVKWHPSWRRFAFFPYDETLFEPDCLRDIADFCEGETKKRKAARAKELKVLAK